jgi:hypothetical protein
VTGGPATQIQGASGNIAEVSAAGGLQIGPAAAVLADADNPIVSQIGALLKASSSGSWYRLLTAAVESQNPINILYTAPAYYDGNLMSKTRGPVIFKKIAATAIVAGTGVGIWTPAVGKKYRLMGWLLSSTVATQLLFGDNTVTFANAFMVTETLVAGGVSASGPALGNGKLSGAINTPVVLDVVANTTVAGMVWGTEE